MSKRAALLFSLRAHKAEREELAAFAGIPPFSLPPPSPMPMPQLHAATRCVSDRFFPPQAIYAEGKEHAMAVGLTKMSTADIKARFGAAGQGRLSQCIGAAFRAWNGVNHSARKRPCEILITCVICVRCDSRLAPPCLFSLRLFSGRPSIRATGWRLCTTSTTGCGRNTL